MQRSSIVSEKTWSQSISTGWESAKLIRSNTSPTSKRCMILCRINKIKALTVDKALKSTRAHKMEETLRRLQNLGMQARSSATCLSCSNSRLAMQTTLPSLIMCLKMTFLSWTRIKLCLPAQLDSFLLPCKKN